MMNRTKYCFNKPVAGIEKMCDHMTGKAVSGGAKKYGGITERDDLLANFRMNCIRETMLDGEIGEYPDFLEERRKLMSLKIKNWFESL
jgi:hypothetical protein